MLKIITCIKQVPDTSKVKINPKDGTLIREGIENIMNPHDLHALETALHLKEQYGGTVTAITMGPEQAEDVLREALSMGVDKAVLISDKRFIGSDSLITSKILSKAIKKLGEFNIVTTGVEAIDGNTSNVSYQISEYLNIPLIRQTHNIEIKNNSAIIERLYGHEYQKIEVELPILVSANSKTNSVRFPALADINRCFNKDISIMTMDDIGGTEGEYGLKGSPSIVIKSESFKYKRKQETITGTIEEKADKLISKLDKHSFIKY